MGGGDPLVWSFDQVVFYPKCVDPFVPHCQHIHPNWITLLNVLVKWFAFIAIVEWSPWGLLFWGTLERFLDCLDGRVARRFNKSSTFGHWMDKSTDLVFRWGSAGYAVYACLPLLAQDILAPGALFSLQPDVPVYTSTMHIVENRGWKYTARFVGNSHRR